MFTSEARLGWETDQQISAASAAMLTLHRSLAVKKLSHDELQVLTETTWPDGMIPGAHMLNRLDVIPANEICQLVV